LNQPSAAHVRGLNLPVLQFLHEAMKRNALDTG
jgi:hypothetical protein